MFCPKKSLSWCKYQADIINGTKTYKRKPGIHRKLFQKIKPVFMDLCSESLLKKCLHGKTQNANESLNGVIWKKCPKDFFVGKSTWVMSVDAAIINFNAGLSRVLHVLEDYGVPKCDYATVYCNNRHLTYYRMQS